MRLYGLKNCDSCRKARKYLQDNGIHVEFVDVRTEGVSEADLDRFLVAFGDDLLNRRSTAWRNLGAEERCCDPLALLKAHPALMKRPVIDRTDRLFLGWNGQVQDAIIG